MHADTSELAVTYGLTLARVLLAAVFLYSGQDKLRHWKASVDEVASLGLPWPRLCAAGTIATQLLGGLAVLIGVGVVYGAAALALFTFAATLLGHPFWRLRGDRAKAQFTTFMEHLAIVGGLLLLMLVSLQGR